MASKRATKLDAMLRHIAAGEDIGDFPGTRYENRALVRAAERRGLILWDKEGNRFVLTPAGWSSLTPRRFGLPSLMVSTAVGAAIGAAALAFLWLPGLQGRDSAYGHATASATQEKPVAAALAAPPAAPGGRTVARVPMSETPIVPASASASATAPTVTPAVAIEPAQAAADPIAEQPAAEAVPTSAKQARKSHHRTARRSDSWRHWRGQRYQDERFSQGFWRSYQ